MILTAFLTYGFAAPENSSRAILRYRNERSSDQLSNGDKGLGASFGPGTRPTGHAAFGVDGASRFDPSRGGTVRAFNGD